MQTSKNISLSEFYHEKQKNLKILRNISRNGKLIKLSLEELYKSFRNLADSSVNVVFEILKV